MVLIPIEPDEAKFTIIPCSSKEEEEGYDLVAIPYSTVRILNCKERWRGKGLADIFQIEFNIDGKALQIKCDTGDVLVNTKRVDSIDQKIFNGDQITHSWIATEPSISITHLPHILLKDGDTLAVYKPPGLPTSPQGQYYRTNIVSLVRDFLSVEFIRPINRLDSAVGGIVILSLNPYSDIQLVEKRYIAKVVGGEMIEENNFFCDAKITVQKHVPNQVLKSIIDDENGVPARTEFRRIKNVDGENASIVECRPITGRTHQIRLHLSHLGHPIVGDETYGNFENCLNVVRKQPSSICLFAYSYSYSIAGSSPPQTVTCDHSLVPSWCPII